MVLMRAACNETDDGGELRFGRQRSDQVHEDVEDQPRTDFVATIGRIPTVARKQCPPIDGLGDKSRQKRERGNLRVSIRLAALTLRATGYLHRVVTG